MLTVIMLSIFKMQLFSGTSSGPHYKYIMTILSDDCIALASALASALALASTSTSASASASASASDSKWRHNLECHWHL